MLPKLFLHVSHVQGKMCYHLFHNILFYCYEGLSACAKTKSGRQLLVVCAYLLIIFVPAWHIWRPYPLSAKPEHVMPLWLWGMHCITWQEACTSYPFIVFGVSGAEATGFEGALKIQFSGWFHLAYVTL